MIGEKSGPELTLESRNGASNIHLDTPRVLREVFAYTVQAIFVECCFITVNQSFYFGVFWITSELPVIETVHLILRKSLESLVLNDIS